MKNDFSPGYDPRRNTTGRPKGAHNKINIHIKNWIGQFLQQSQNQFEADMLELSPRDRVLIYEKLLKYILPTEKTPHQTEFEILTDGQIDEIIEKLKNG